MGRWFLFVSGLCVLAFSLGAAMANAAEELRFGTASKDDPVLYLPVLAAEDRGFWKENGLELKFFPFKGARLLYDGLVAGDIMMGHASVASFVQAAGAGVPVTMVGQLKSESVIRLYVLADSPLRKPGDIKGAKIGVTRFGSVTHLYAQAIAKALGLEKDVRLIATGGSVENMAALKRGGVDVVPSGFAVLELAAKREVRPLLQTADFLPKDWSEFAIIASRALVKERPETVRKAVKAVSQAIIFISQNPQWAIAKIKLYQGFSEEAAKRAYEMIGYTKGAKINERGLRNIIDFLAEGGLFKKEKLPPLTELYTTRFTEPD